MGKTITAPLLILGLCLSAAAEPSVASIDFMDGPVSVTRAGAIVKGISIGDELLDADQLATGPGGSFTISLSKSATGMNGTIKISQKTTFYLNVDELKGEKQTQAELIAGQIALKLKKAIGSPGLSVVTESAVMAVRGTDFEVTATAGGSVLVGCAEGEVECSDESGRSSATPGQAIEKREGTALKKTAVAVGDYSAFKEKWVASEAERFKKGAPAAAKLIAARYTELADKLASLHKDLSTTASLLRWMDDYRGGKGSRASDAELEAQIVELGPRLLEARKTLAAMERIAARVEALEKVVKDDSSVMSQALRKGYTISDFFNKFEAEKERNALRVAWLRHASKLFKLRSLESEARRAAPAKR